MCVASQVDESPVLIKALSEVDVDVVKFPLQYQIMIVVKISQARFYDNEGVKVKRFPSSVSLRRFVHDCQGARLLARVTGINIKRRLIILLD